MNAGLKGRRVLVTGAFRFDSARPDGQPRRSLDTIRAADLLAWKATTILPAGLARTVPWSRSHRESPS